MKTRKTRRTRYRLLAMLSVVVLAAAACGGDSDSTDEGRGGTDESVVNSIGDTEGALSLIAWVGSFAVFAFTNALQGNLTAVAVAVS